MAATLTWTETAIAQLADIAEYIAQDSPRNAQRAVERIIVAVEGLARFPLRGHIVAEFGRENLRELTWRKYRIVCRAAKDSVRIIAVVHGARQLKDLISDDMDTD